MNYTSTNISVTKTRVKYTIDYSGKWYDGERPNTNWSAFLMLLDKGNHLLTSPRFKIVQK